MEKVMNYVEGIIKEYSLLEKDAEKIRKIVKDAVEINLFPLDFYPMLAIDVLIRKHLEEALKNKEKNI